MKIFTIYNIFSIEEGVLKSYIKWFLEGSNMGSKRFNQTSKLTKLKLFRNLILKNSTFIKH